MADALTAELVGMKTCAKCNVPKGSKAFPADGSCFGGRGDVCTKCLSTRKCRKCDGTLTSMTVKGRNRLICKPCDNAYNRERRSDRPMVCSCGENDTSKLAIQGGKMIRYCRACLAKAAEVGRKSRSEKPPTLAVITCMRCREQKQVVCRGEVIPKSCRDCIDGRVAKAAICVHCGTTDDICQGDGWIKRICRGCDTKKRKGVYLGYFSDKVKPPEPVMEPEPVEVKAPSSADSERMAKVRAAIKAIPVGVTVTPAMLYDISRRVAEGAL